MLVSYVKGKNGFWVSMASNWKEQINLLEGRTSNGGNSDARGNGDGDRDGFDEDEDESGLLRSGLLRR